MYQSRVVGLLVVGQDKRTGLSLCGAQLCRSREIRKDSPNLNPRKPFVISIFYFPSGWWSLEATYSVDIGTSFSGNMRAWFTMLHVRLKA